MARIAMGRSATRSDPISSKKHGRKDGSSRRTGAESLNSPGSCCVFKGYTPPDAIVGTVWDGSMIGWKCGSVREIKMEKDKVSTVADTEEGKSKSERALGEGGQSGCDGSQEEVDKMAWREESWCVGA